MEKIKTIIGLTITTLSIIVFGVVLRNTFFYIPSGETNIPTILQTYLTPHENTALAAENIEQLYTNHKENPLPDSYPSILDIPSIGIDTHIQYVGTTKRGNMASPNNFSDVGWFKYGVVPGEKGNAVIAGHVNNGLALPGVFKNLDTLTVGDDVYIHTINTDIIHFTIIDIYTLDFNAPTEDIFNKNNGEFLTLITCTGVWVPEIKTHNKRLIVIAKRI